MQTVRKYVLQRTHAIFGFEVDLATSNSNIEGYYKWFNQLSNINRNKLYEENTDNVDEVLKKDYIIETGDAYGTDLLLKYNNDKTYLWFVYSIAK